MKKPGTKECVAVPAQWNTTVLQSYILTHSSAHTLPHFNPSVSKKQFQERYATFTHRKRPHMAALKEGERWRGFLMIRDQLVRTSARCQNVTKVRWSDEHCSPAQNIKREPVGNLRPIQLTADGGAANSLWREFHLNMSLFVLHFHHNVAGQKE